MDELLEQFLLESRELVAQAVDDLLVLERNPEDRARINGAFRAFHTLKGAAGIIDFAPMAEALHAAEDELAGVRAGGVLTPLLVDACLSCLDQVGLWLDAIERDGAPPADAGLKAAAVVMRFRKGASSAPSPTASVSTPSDEVWLAAFRAAHGDVVSARSAVRYRPSPSSFFAGEDPLAIAARIPGLAALALAPVQPWPDLADLDPFRCNVEISILSTSSSDEVRAAMAGASGEVFVAPLGGAASLPPAARSMLESQLAVLAGSTADGLRGRIGAAGSVAGNVLRRAGREGDAEVIAQAAAISLEQGTAVPLANALAAMLDGRGAPGPRAEDVATVPESPAVMSANRSLRVDVERIETLVNLAGELIVLKNAIGYSADLAQSDAAGLAPRLKEQHAALDRLAEQLRNAVLGVRIVPFRAVFQRFPRLVRDLAVNLGKEITLTTAGDDAEADKAVVEALFEPLLHVVRNAADHGIETQDLRRSRGKPPRGEIRLSARRDGEHVVVEVADDGSGIDAQRIRELAIERRVAPRETLAAMGDDEVIDLIFAPGFSTAAAITDVSGRGVGMDAVRSAIERMGGRVSVASRLGVGSTVAFRVPLTVMVTRLMTVEVGGQPFGVGLEAVVETALVPRDRILPVGTTRAFVLRDRTVPLIDLRSALGKGHQESTQPARIVVVSVGGMLGAIEVDRLGERLDAIVKPTGGLLGGASAVAGTTLLGDGRVLIVLDLAEILG